MSLFTDDVKEIGDLFPELAGLPHIVQLSKHYYDIKDDSTIVFPVAGELKEDGVYGFVVKHEGQVYLFGRSGLRLTNVDFIAKRFTDCADGTYHGEVVNDNWSLEKLSGATSPARVNPLEQVDAVDLLYYGHIRLFDFISIDEFRAGISKTAYEDRRKRLTVYNHSGECEIKHILLHTVEEMLTHASELSSSGLEGGCYKEVNGDWKRGRRDHRSIKVVSEVSFDLECIRVEDGKGKRAGMVANMFFRWKGGLELKADMGKGYGNVERIALYLNPPIGKIFRVTAMKESSVNGLLRKAKVKELREDKLVPDF